MPTEAMQRLCQNALPLYFIPGKYLTYFLRHAKRFRLRNPSCTVEREVADNITGPWGMKTGASM